jgi:hypothetical protein
VVGFGIGRQGSSFSIEDSVLTTLREISFAERRFVKRIDATAKINLIRATIKSSELMSKHLFVALVSQKNSLVQNSTLLFA